MSQDNKTLIILAYFSALLGVCGNASSEFFVKLSGISGWRCLFEIWLRRFCLIILCIINPSSRNLIAPLKRLLPHCYSISFWNGIWTVFISLGFRLCICCTSCTMVTIMPIELFLCARIIEGTKITTPK